MSLTVKINKNESGNTQIFFLTAALLVIILFLFLFDILKIFVYREVTKNVADSACLAAAQSLIYFEPEECKEIAGYIVDSNGCMMEKFYIDYNKIGVTVRKKINFLLTGKIFKKYSVIYSKSEAGIVFPWDDRFGYCDSYIFKY